MKTKFKVGDKVRLLDGSGIKDFACDWVETMKSDIGRITTITRTVPQSHKIRLKGIFWIWDDRCIELVESAPDTNVGDKVNHPSHYNQGKYECIDVMAETFGKEAVLNFCKLNAFKYLWRAEDKNGHEDINKALWYLNKYIELTKGE